MADRHSSAPGLHTATAKRVSGSILRQAAIREILVRLDKASRVARRIDASQQKLNGKRRSPVHRLAGLIKGIYNTLDQEHGNSQYIHDVRLAETFSAMSIALGRAVNKVEVKAVTRG